MRGVLIVAMLLLVAVTLSNAQTLTVQGMAVMNCGALAEGPFSCGTVQTFVCYANTTADYINNVRFVFTHGTETSSIDGVQISGTNNSGYWGVNVTIDAYPWYLESVQAQDSASQICGSEDWIRQGMCHVTFNDTARKVNGTCTVQTCVWSNITTCNPDGTLLTQWIPNEYCTGVAYNLTGTCEFCTPNWVQIGTACEVNYTNDDPFAGTTTIKYSDTNDCYAKTGLLKDAEPPVGQDYNDTCLMDYWINDGRDSTGSYQNTNSPYSAADLTARYANGNIGGTAYNARKPLVFDVNRDGMNDVAALFDGVWNIYDGNMTLEYAVATYTDGNPSFAQGQPSLGGVSVWKGGTEFWFDSTLYNGYGPALVAVVKDSTYWFTSSQWNGTGFQVRVALDLGTYNWNVTSGVTCFKQYCYFITDSNVIAAVDWKTGAVTSINPNSPSVVYSNVTYRDSRVPVVSPSTTDTPDRVLVLGEDVNGAALFNCDLTLSSCNSFSIGEFQLDEMSRLAVVGPSADGKYHVAFTTSELVT